MVVYYFGADAPWAAQTEGDINRRNMAVLLTLAQQPQVEVVYNIIRCTRTLLFKKTLQIRSQHPKIKNLYIAPIVPETGVLKWLTRPINHWILKGLYKGALKRHKQAISWCYWPKGYSDYKFLGLENPMLFDTDHNIIDNPYISEAEKPKRAALLEEAAHKATYVLSSSRSMLHWFQDKGFSNTRLLMNGVFGSRIQTDHQIHHDTYQVTYCGTLSKWIKLDWLLQMAKDQPQWLIHIIGQNYKTELSAQLQDIANIRLHGFLKPSEVDRILQTTDVCIGLYREDKGLDVNSMKLYDYLAKGLPVVVNNYHPHLKDDFNGSLNHYARLQ